MKLKLSKSKNKKFKKPNFNKKFKKPNFNKKDIDLDNESEDSIAEIDFEGFDENDNAKKNKKNHFSKKSSKKDSFDEEDMKDDSEDLEDEDLEDEDLDDEEDDENNEFLDEEIDGNFTDDEIEDEDDEEDISTNDQFKVLKKIKINDAKIQDWSNQLKTNPNKSLFVEIVTALKVAVKCISGESSKLRVESAIYFNPLLKLVLIDFLPAMHKVLQLEDKIEKDKTELRVLRPRKSKYWKKYSAIIKVYLKTILDVVDNFSDDSILSTLLKHILELVPFYLCYVALIKKILKSVSQMWSEGKEEIRVLSFLILIRLLRDQKSELISYIMKKLYISYVRNCKFTNEENFAMINFMKQSLVELYSLDQGVAYQHAFIYIRQCAVSLRTSMMSNKKEGFKSVYNWQYIHSLLLWVQMIACLNPSEVLKPLIFPLTQVILGTIKLIPSSRYIPLKLHLIKSLVKLSTSTNTFIPILPYLNDILEVLERTKKYKSGSEEFEKINFDIILKVPNNYINNQQFAEKTIKKIYDLTLEYTSKQSHLISFPELVLIFNVRMRKFLKSWKNPNDCKLLKQLLDKINESSKFMELKRKNNGLSIIEEEKIDAFEKDIKLNVTPLFKFYDSQIKKSINEKVDLKEKKKSIEKSDTNLKNKKENLKRKSKNEKTPKRKLNFKNKIKKKIKTVN